MCGIAGIVNFRSGILSNHKKELSKMLECIKHRGPDAEGTAQPSTNCLLGHTRLSIIDLNPRANQPMRFRHIWMTYNGEIYNFLELKAELERDRYTFETTSDTEVILKLFDKYGIECFSRLKGMFAIAIWDERSKSLILARDPVSIKPLYYSFDGETLYFGSEIKQFVQLNKFSENKEWLPLFLTFGSIPFGKTTLNEVHMLKGSHFIIFNRQVETFKTMRYEPASPPELPIKEIFQKCISTHIISDAPLGVFLSGGTDSSVITLAAKQIKKDLDTLSVTWGIGDESRYQRLIHKLVSSNHKTYQLDLTKFSDNFDNFFNAMDQPTVDGINTFFIAQCAKESGLKTVLSGVGGDELGLGYKHYRKFNLYAYLFNNPLLTKVLKFNMNLRIKMEFLKYQFLKPLKFYLLVRGIYSPRFVEMLTGIHASKVVDIINSNFQSFIDPAVGNDVTIDSFNFLEREIYLKSQLLKDTDFMGMHHSLEIRVPFLDIDFYNAMLKIPTAEKLQSKINKFTLVKLVDTLPAEIYQREKQGFTLPFDRWLKSFPYLVNDYLRKFSDDKLINSLNEAFKRGKLHWSKIWILIAATKLR
ncbi:MAG: asparagine synthase (glutamine-hydrolyzing) [Planctomycetes bacterium]|nr:asparagine synthase (glutamine-hydrolyzing) [Planctomycetota bacterium]